MSFSSITFLFYFLPISISLYYLIPTKGRKFYLIIISLIFYFYNSIQNAIIITGMILYNYFSSKKLATLTGKLRKYQLIEILFVNLFLLCYFKYYFLILQKSSEINYKTFLLPIGFSFYLFETLSYVIDIYTKKIPKPASFLNFCLYITYFPKLLMGPIVKYQDFSKEIDNLTTTPSLFHLGFKRFIIGLSMKVILADTFLSIINNFQVNSLIGCLILITSYSIQIYFDFAGYTNMAIGISNIFGIQLEENFNYPYIAKNISDFWRRWHITLGRWFKDYIYIPLGGNRVGQLKLIRNTLIVWLLTGMWHGASFNFLLWGLYFGILITIEKSAKKYLQLPKLISIPITFLLVSIGWIFFFNNDLSNITFLLKQLTNFQHLIDNEAISTLKTFLPYFILALLLITPLPKIIGQKVQEKCNFCYNLINIVYLSLLLILSISYLISGSYQPFLYFNF